MSSRLANLLQQEEPLDPGEVAELREWLGVLRQDCEMFGATGEDEFRMHVIQLKIDSQS